MTNKVLLYKAQLGVLLLIATCQPIEGAMQEMRLPGDEWSISALDVSSVHLIFCIFNAYQLKPSL